MPKLSQHSWTALSEVRSSTIMRLSIAVEGVACDRNHVLFRKSSVYEVGGPVICASRWRMSRPWISCFRFSSAIKALICMRCRRSVTPDRGLLLSWSLITIGLATLVMCGSFCCGRLAFLAAAAARVRLPAIMEYWKEGRRRKKRCHYGNSKTFYVVSRTLRRSPGGCVLYSGLA